MTSFTYTPLPDNSKTIRLLILHPAPDQNAQVTGELVTVDLNDQTRSYKDFQARLTEQLHYIHPYDRGLTRHFMWNLVNRDPLELNEPRFSETVHEVVRGISVFEFCDRPLELMSGLIDRFSWGDFLALSYVWGDPTERRTILLNGIPFGVGSSLHAALVRLRSSYEVAERGLKVWIDAICINQDDLNERSVEVQKMGLIYSEALVVRGWLGECPAPYLRGDLSAIRTIWDLEADFLHRKDQLAPLETLRKLRGSTPFPNLIEDVANSDKAFQIALFHKDECLFTQKYWERLWVIQEMALASSLLLWYEQDGFFITPRECRSPKVQDVHDSLRLVREFGRAHVTWTLLKRTLATHRLHWFREPVPLELGDEMATSSEGIGPVTLNSLIYEARLSQCSDPRDKIFGILAMLPDRISSRIRPRYDDPVVAVWSSFSRVCFEQEGNLALLARTSGQRGDTDTVVQGLPSWAFDLTNPLEGEEDVEDPHGHFLPYDRFKRMTRLVTPGFFGRSAADESIPAGFAFSDDGQHLICKAVFVDIVTAVTVDRGDGTTPLMVEEAQALADPLPRKDLKSARLSLGRVLSFNSKWQPPNHPTILDIPWPGDFTRAKGGCLELPDDLDEHTQRAEDEAFAKGEPVPWAAYFRNSIFNLSFLHISLMNYADFELHGIPLREYFTSNEETCPPAEVLGKPEFYINRGSDSRRLFRTRKGRIGSLLYGGRPGDRIAVVGGCDVPLILRPRGQEYVIVDNCVVDGLMDGQAAEMVARGEAKIEEISIC